MKKDGRVGLLFALPWIIGFLIFLTYPLVASFIYSFTNFSILREPKFVGLSNYRELAGDDVFVTSLKNTMIYVLGAVPLSTVIAIMLALLLNTKVKGMAYYRTIFFLPSLLPMVALGTLFSWVFNGDYGLLNEILRTVHVSPPSWMSDPSWAKVTLVLIAGWGCGQAMIIYLAGLQDVPVSLYEAADIDGAKVWQKTRSVTLPMLSPVILFNVVMGIIGALQVFAVPYVMFPGGSPARSTYMFAMYLFDNAFEYQRMGYASAMGWIMFLITLGLTVVSIKISDIHVHYEANT
jgi:multiple sugar transport system permease protein